MGEKKKRVKEEYFPELDEHGFMVDLQDLKKSYQATHRFWSEKRRPLQEQLQQMTAIPLEELQKKENRKERARMRAEYADLYDEISDIDEITSDLNYTINWLHTGKQPGTKRGIERRSVYQNTVLLDPMIMASFANPSNSRSGSSLTEDQKTVLRDVLELLSPQEKECYVMAHGHGISHEQIANMLGISKGSVTTYIKRAHDKVSKGWQGSFF